MKKTVYHGSDHIIERPKYGYGKIYNAINEQIPKSAQNS